MLALFEDILSDGAALVLPARPRMVFVVHGGIAADGAETAEGAAWHGQQAVTLRAGPHGAALWRWDLIQGDTAPPPGAVNMWDEYNKWKRANPEAHAAALRGGLIGSPETIRRKLRKFQSSNIDQVVLLNQAGRNTHEHICESLELFAKEVMPEFQGAHPELLKWKEKVLNREIELEEIDTSAFTDRYGGTMKNISPAADRRVQAAE